MPDRRDDPLELFTIAEVAARLRRSKSSVWADIHDGRLRVVRIGRRGTRVARAELERYIEAHEDGHRKLDDEGVDE